MWDFIAGEVDLTVYLLESNSMFNKDRGNRGKEWATTGGRAYKTIEAPTWRLSRGELTVYTAKHAFLERHHDAVILGGWESPAYWQTLFAARRGNLPTIGFFESTLRTSQFRSGPIARARRLFFRLVDAVVVPGSAARDAVLAMGVPNEKIYVGFNAVDVRQIHQAAEKSRSSCAAPTHSPGHEFIYVGRLIGLKNLRSLLKAFALVRAPEDRLTIVGQGSERSVLEDLANHLGLGSSVVFAGLMPYSELGPTLAAAHTLVLPSTKEVWGLVVNEALAAGLQVVVSDACGVADSVIGMRGVFITGTSVVGLADGLLKARNSWHGPTHLPDVLEKTPEAFGRVFLDAVRSTSPTIGQSS
ncbi:glycosyltransferase family 4 protein [Cryobacterium sp. TMT1-21]|uniref:glycosyltransferase family 4 protein n=1 Tax=Cryobacterium sp. TMT1-21 TaxID=1259234 RepID=UPI00141BAC51|nr:glycosyltransferase family 4 protein [Cryobacterium sp. TMT1-21]